MQAFCRRTDEHKSIVEKMQQNNRLRCDPESNWSPINVGPSVDEEYWRR